MSKKLKKKTKTQGIIFPHPQFVHFDLDKFHEQGHHSPPKSKHKHRVLSKSCDKLSVIKEANRSLSINQKAAYNNLLSYKKPKNESEQKQRRAKSGIVSKHKRTTNSAAAISSIFYKGMEKNLAKECEQILKLQKPKRSISSCKLQNIQPNLFFLKRKEQDSQPRPKRKISRSHAQLKTVINITEQQILRASVMEVASFNFVNNSSDHIKSDQESMIEINAGSESDSLIELVGSQFIKKSSNKDKKDLKKVSIMGSQLSFQNITKSIYDTKVHLISSKFMTRSVPIFTILKLKVTTNNIVALQIFLQICDHLIFRKILSINENRLTDFKIKKAHSRSRYQHVRQKTKDRIFNHFQKAKQSQNKLQIYEDLLLYIEGFMRLEHSYIGRTLIYNDQMNHEKIDFLKGIKNGNQSNSQYFFLKLCSTFYLVKATLNSIPQIDFTFLCDFTTLSHGDQLIFPHIKPLTKHGQSKKKPILAKAIQQFQKAAQNQWHQQQHQNQDLISKIGRMQYHSMEKVMDQQIVCNWNFNKKYQMIGELQNFFQKHDHFDMGFFKRGVTNFRIEEYHYQLMKNRPILFYKYPNNFEIIPVTRVQKEAFLIAHLPPYTKSIKKLVVRSFFKKVQQNEYKRKQKNMIILIKNKRVYLQLFENKVDLYIESIHTMRKHKISLNLTQFLKKSINLKKQSVSETVEEIIEDYKLKPSFLYNRLEKSSQERVTIYHKALYKLENQYCFVTLYKLKKIGLIEFKIHLFKMGREFIIPLSLEQISFQNIKQTVHNIIVLFKSIYLKKFLQIQVRKSQQKRKEQLEDFFKNQLKINPNNLRMKRKQQLQVRRRNMKIDSVKGNIGSFNIFECITSKLWKNSKGKQFYFTIRYLPSTQVKESKSDTSQEVLVCLHVQGQMFHFHLTTTLRQLTACAKSEWRGLEQLDALQKLFVFRQVANVFTRLADENDNKLRTLISKIKHFLSPKLSKRDMTIHPLKYTLVGRQLFQTREPVAPHQIGYTELSIDIDFVKDISYASSHVIDEGLDELSDWRMPSPSFGRFSKNLNKQNDTLHMVDIGPFWIVQIVDTTNKNDQIKIESRIKDRRQVHLINRQHDKKIILNSWQGDFINTIKYQQFNKRMFRRLLRGLRKIV